jgi:hypothetical protein
LGAMMFQNKTKNQKDHYNVLVFVKKRRDIYVSNGLIKQRMRAR